jgi:hypothetical protein
MAKNGSFLRVEFERYVYVLTVHPKNQHCLASLGSEAFAVTDACMQVMEQLHLQ